MKSWRRPFDNRSCQSRSRQFYFLSAPSHCRHPLCLWSEWAEWCRPHSAGCSLLTLEQLLSGNHLLKLWGREAHAVLREKLGSSFSTWESWSSSRSLQLLVIWIQKIAPEIANKPQSQTWSESPLFLPSLRAKISSSLTGFNFLDDSGSG